ncbi:hypothetical protein BGZ73_003087 [Actinomortierella ambigua]|nr:hypothetical protein BGZ73_003087 [Actinomortierella ambigua]
MSDKELLAQIAQLAGAINKHNVNMTAAGEGYGYTPMHARGGYSGMRGRGGPPFNFRGRGRGGINGSVHRSLTLNNNNSNHNNNHLLSGSSATGTTLPSLQITPSPTTSGVPGSPASRPSLTPSPLPSPLKSGGWPVSPQPRSSRHLTLNVKAQQSGSTPSPSPSPSPSLVPINTAVGPRSSLSIDKATGQQWVQSKGKNMSLMTPEKYEKTMVAKQKSILSMKKAKLKAKQARAKRMQDLRKGIVTIGDTSYAKSADGRKLVINKQQSGSILIDGIEFEMDARGNKLVRKGLAKNSSSNTAPSFASTSAGLAPPSTSSATNTTTTPKALSVDGVKYVRTTSGNLVRASLVRNQLLQKQARQRALAEKRRIAAENKRAAQERLKSIHCKFFTRLGRCPKQPRCPFMHSRNHLAICKKFLRGQINPKAPLCIPFAKEGWCDKGGTCKDRHAWICPDFNSKQGCHRRCGLAHVPEQGSRDKTPAKPNGSQAPFSRRAQFNHQGNNNTNSATEQDVALESKSSNIGQYDENFIPLDLDSKDDDDAGELVLHQQMPDPAELREQAQGREQEAQSQGLSDETEDESEESEEVEEMDVDSEGMMSDESDDDIEEEEEKEGEGQSPDHQDKSVGEYDEDEEEDEDDYMAYYQDEEEDDRGEY